MMGQVTGSLNAQAGVRDALAFGRSRAGPGRRRASIVPLWITRGEYLMRRHCLKAPTNAFGFYR